MAAGKEAEMRYGWMDGSTRTFLDDSGAAAHGQPSSHAQQSARSSSSRETEGQLLDIGSKISVLEPHRPALIELLKELVVLLLGLLRL